MNKHRDELAKAHTDWATMLGDNNNVSRCLTSPMLSSRVSQKSTGSAKAKKAGAGDSGTLSKIFKMVNEHETHL